jgi:hypothetical protein
MYVHELHQPAYLILLLLMFVHGPFMQNTPKLPLPPFSLSSSFT